MNPELSVIVVTLNEEENLDRVLARITRDSGLEALEVLVVDGGSRDRTEEIAARYARVIRVRRGRASQLEAGLREVRGKIICFCHGDTLLPDGYGRMIQRAVKPGVVGGAFQPVYEPGHWLLKGLSWVLRIPTPYLMFGDQAMFARRVVLNKIGGVPQLALMEDVALALALDQHGKLIRLPERVITSSRRLIERGVFRQLILDLKLLFQYHVLRIPAEMLAAEYNVTERDRLLTETVQPQTVGIMAKAPIPGRVKTRLGQSIGMNRSAAVFGELLESLIRKFEDLPENVQLVIMAASREDRDWFKEHYPELLVIVQQGKHLGERLLNACLELKMLGAEDLLLISADTPALKVKYIRDAFQALAETDLVLGPNLDGGYYLIGQSKCRAELYSDIPWSTSLVMQKTLERARESQLSVKYLPTLRDIDTIDDWLEFQNQSKNWE